MRLSNINPLVEAALIGIVCDSTPEQSIGVARLARYEADAAVAEVRDHAAGAIATFIGTTRAQSRRREVIKLE